MVAFAANSLLCRGALAAGSIDAYSFTAIRVASGAFTLGLIALLSGRHSEVRDHGSWESAAALLGYALAFSIAYLTLDAGTGALILFGSVQVTMILGGLLRGEQPPPRRWLGLALAGGGLVYLLLPGASAPDPFGGVMMLGAGVSWGVYSLRGREAPRPLLATARNFGLALPMAVVALLLGWGAYHAEFKGVLLAVLSGGVASGLGYSLWYRALRGLTATSAAIVQLSVPVIAAIGGILLFQEIATMRLLIAGIVTLGGIAIAVTAKRD